MDASNVKDALKFKSEKEAKNTLNGLDWQFRSNYEIVKEGYEKETSLWLDKAFSGLDYQWKDGALIVPKGWRGKVARRMKGDGIKPPIKGIKEEVELNEMKWVVGGVYHQEF